MILSYRSVWLSPIQSDYATELETIKSANEQISTLLYTMEDAKIFIVSTLLSE